MKPRLFVGSSVESLYVAYAVQQELDHDFEVTVWSQNVFQPTSNTLTDLLTSLDKYDAALFVFSPEDETNLRGSSVRTIRDNVLFEFGLFLAKLGPSRCFFLVPHSATDFHLPTDLLGINPATYNPNRQDRNIRAAVGPACHSVREGIRNAGGLLTSDSAQSSTSELHVIGMLPEKYEAAKRQMLQALLHKNYLWRTIRRLAEAGGVSQDQAVSILTASEEVDWGTSESDERIAKLKSRTT